MNEKPLAMRILVISNNYPSESIPSRGVFVYNLIQQFAKLGHEITIVAPVGLLQKTNPSEKGYYGEELGKVYRPKFVSASTKNFFGFNTYRVAELSQIWQVKKTVARNEIEFDVIYAHFLTNAFIAAGALYSFGKPIYAAIGESDLDVPKSRFSPSYFKKVSNRIKGFVAVSPFLKDKLVSYGINENKITIKPNAVDFSTFYKREKIKMRTKHNLPLDKKLLIFVGRFIDHKGPLRLLEAAREIKDVCLLFVGSGDQKIEGEKVVFCDKTPSEVVPELLSASDVFVLPTQKEGSCNAIVEAMACGLPIVSSNIPEVQVQCDPSFSILVDPTDVLAIRNAIENIISNSNRLETMSAAALDYSRNFDIRNRAKSILEFISN